MFFINKEIKILMIYLCQGFDLQMYKGLFLLKKTHYICIYITLLIMFRVKELKGPVGQIIVLEKTIQVLFYCFYQNIF